MKEWDVVPCRDEKKLLFKLNDRAKSGWEVLQVLFIPESKEFIAILWRERC